MPGPNDSAVFTSAAVAALNVAVVRLTAFEVEARELAERQDESAEEIDQTASESRERFGADAFEISINAPVGDVSESTVPENTGSNSGGFSAVLEPAASDAVDVAV